MRWLILGAALSALTAPALAAEFMLNSTEVKSGSPMSIAQAFTACKGQNISPALTWSGEPPGTQSFAATIYDPDARAGDGWWHWMVFNIPATVHALAAGAGGEGSKDLPAGASQGRNDFGVSQYSGPCPPVGDHAHHYEITVHAIKVASCRWTIRPQVPRSTPSCVPTHWPRLKSSDATRDGTDGVFRLVRSIQNN